MQHYGTWLSVGTWQVRQMVELNDLEGLCQPRWFYVSVILGTCRFFGGSCICQLSLVTHVGKVYREFSFPDREYSSWLCLPLHLSLRTRSTFVSIAYQLVWNYLDKKSFKQFYFQGFNNKYKMHINPWSRSYFFLIKSSSIYCHEGPKTEDSAQDAVSPVLHSRGQSLP